MRQKPILSRTLSPFILALAFMIATITGASAYNMRQLTNADGLTNSAILSLCQDSKGFLWIGTCDGVNIYNGITVHPLSEAYPQHPISGNIVEGMMESEDSIMWIRTNHGLNRLNKETGHLRVFPEFQGREMLRQNSQGDIFVLDEKKKVYVYNPASEEFRTIHDLTIDRDSILEIAFAADKMLLFSNGGIFSRDLRTTSPGEFVGGQTRCISSTPLKFARRNGKNVVTVDMDGTACSFNLSTYTTESITNLSPLLASRGVISDIIFKGDNTLFISFETAGVVRADRADGFIPHDLGLTAGIFCMLASDKQDLIWIGSDCQGLYTYYAGQFDITSLSFNHFGNRISHPIRTVDMDSDGALWLGTKGDGILQVKDFNYRDGSYSSMRLFNSYNSPLKHNMVFATAKSSGPRMWIGTEEGINLYDYTTDRIADVDTHRRIRWVHGIYEQNDTILWIASIGQGVWRAVIDANSPSAAPRFKSVKQYTLDNGNFSSNYFFSLSVDDKGNPVFSNRGVGAVLFDEKGDSLKVVTLTGDYSTRTVNDVFATYKDGDDYWMATGQGLLHKTPKEENLYNGFDKGFANSTIHSLLKAKDGNIWVSTNRGLVRFNPSTERGYLFDEDFGVKISEFSDGAAYLSPEGFLLFGGIDGVAMIARDQLYKDDSSYHPSTWFAGLTIEGQNVGLTSEYFKRPSDLTLSYDQPYFTLSFATPDFMSAYNLNYFFSLDGREWMGNGRNSSWSFTRMPPGKYTLYVKYVNLQTGAEGEPLVINLRITPPWYLSTAAKIIYTLLILGVIALVVIYFLRRQRRNQQRTVADIKAAHKEEVYEEKLKFFTNITHEFCTPLTLIYGPCERILSYEGADSYIRKYVTLIRNNTRRLNNLIQEIIDFRRIETGNNRRKVRHIDVSDLCKDIIESFSDLAERNNIMVINNVAPDIVWNTDYRSISKIVTNLVSNAFKYTAPGGTVRIGLEKKEDKLVLTVYNTGKGIREEDKERVFNHYAILDNVEEKATKGLTARNGLGMAICHSMVDILEGTIEIDSEVGSYACFIVTLPQLELDSEEPVTQQEKAVPTIPLGPVPETTVSAPHVREEEEEKARQALPADISEPDALTTPRRKGQTPKILLVDDNEEMLTLLADSLSEYDIITATDGEKALQAIVESTPDLVITDIMMPGTDGLELTRQIKSNRHTMHVPLIILSAKNSNEEIVAGIETGADVYISKPFSFSYLRAVIKRLLDYNSKLREYYNSSASAYEYSGGQLLEREGKEFIDRITAFIDDNIDNADLSPDMLAQHLSISMRNLYRKFKDLGQLPPNDFIKAHRISFAARLLCTTSLTIQEIIYRCGFSNRSHFYKEFDKRFQMTPKEYRTANRTRDESLI